MRIACVMVGFFKRYKTTEFLKILLKNNKTLEHDIIFA